MNIYFAVFVFGAVFGAAVSALAFEPGATRLRRQLERAALYLRQAEQTIGIMIEHYKLDDKPRLNYFPQSKNKAAWEDVYKEAQDYSKELDLETGD
jgi:hypothetical protein